MERGGSGEQRVPTLAVGEDHPVRTMAHWGRRIVDHSPAGKELSEWMSYPLVPLIAKLKWKQEARDSGWGNPQTPVSQDKEASESGEASTDVQDYIKESCITLLRKYWKLHVIKEDLSYPRS